MKLSVIIPCFNAADTLGVQLEALATQIWEQPWEVIVANNNSTDDSMRIVATFQTHMPNLRIVDASDRQGQPYALNTGAAAALGESLAFCDADDQVAPGWLAAMGESLAIHDFVACRWDVERLNTPTVQASRGSGQAKGLQQYTYPPYLPHAGGGSLGVKRRLHMQIGGFDESLPALHDTDYCWRLQLMGIQLHFVPDAVIHIRFRDTTSGVFKQARRYGKFNVVLYRRYQRHGMPSLRWTREAKAWMKLLRRSPRIFDAKERVKWVRDLGWHCGRLEASVTCRIPVLRRSFISQARST